MGLARGEVGACYHQTNFCALVPPKTERVAGLAEEDYQILERLFHDPTFTLVDRACFAAWGCRPHALEKA